MRRIITTILLLLLTLPAYATTVSGDCNFGFVSTSTVGYTIYDSSSPRAIVTARTTSGITNTAGGDYTATITIPTSGSPPYFMYWDSGGSNPIWGIAPLQNTATVSGVVTANVTEIAGQTAVSSGSVTFPSSIGTSTYAGGSVASVTGNVGGNVVGSVASVTAPVSIASGQSVASVTGAVASVTGNVGGNVIGTVNANVVSYAVNEDPATLVLDTLASSHNTSLTIGAKINSAANASDPWSTSITKTTYSGHQAGYILWVAEQILEGGFTYSGTAAGGALTLNDSTGTAIVGPYGSTLTKTKTVVGGVITSSH